MIKIALYKKRTSLFNRCIYFWQSLRGTREYRHYTHVEIVVNGVWYTASNRQGIRKRAILGLNGHWDFIELEATREQEYMISDWYNERMGAKYDWYGIFLSQILPLNIEHPKKWFCSESVYSSLIHSGVLKKDKHAQWYSPARLIKYIHQEEKK